MNDELKSGAAGQTASLPADDLVLPFRAERAGVNGRLVRLGPSVDEIISKHDYPEPVSGLLGEAVALTALLGTAIKTQGQFTLQAQTDGLVSLLVADYQTSGAIRGYARYDEDALNRLDEEELDNMTARLLGRGHLAMTPCRGQWPSSKAWPKR